MTNYIKNQIVTVNLGSVTSNIFIVDSDEGETLLVHHPLSKNLLMRIKKTEVNKASASLKDSTERSLDYANANKSIIDHNTSCDLDSIGIYYSFFRKLTPSQKKVLSNICGQIASVKLNDDLKSAMILISKNSSILDDFNLMWFNNFKGLFSGEQRVTSLKQRTSIFNMAGYVLAELENPTTQITK